MWTIPTQNYWSEATLQSQRFLLLEFMILRFGFSIRGSWKQVKKAGRILLIRPALLLCDFF